MEAVITEVATKRRDLIGVRRGDIIATNQLQDAGGLNFQTSGLNQGDIIEVLTGPSAGMYPVLSIASDTATIQSNAPFLATQSNVAYRVWGGIHGSRRMVTVGPHESDNGLVSPGKLMPYVLRRPGVHRVSSTEMESNHDGTLYYADVQIESSGAGDELNLEEGVRLVVQSGASIDGYKYSVENNNLTFSLFEEVSLDFDRRFLPVGNSDSPENMTEISGRNLKVTFETSTTTRTVHTLMRSDTERPINANPLARHFLPSFVRTSFVYEGGANVSDVGQEMEDYINGLGGEDELEVSDLEAFLTRRGATSIRHPIELVTVTHDIDRNLVVDRSEDKIGGFNPVPFNGTGRISAFFATLGEGLQVERE
jgi:hypothetical protein